MKKIIWFASCLGACGAIVVGQGCGSQAVEFPDSLKPGAAATAGCTNGNDCTPPLGCVPNPTSLDGKGTCGNCTATIQCATAPARLVCNNGACGAETAVTADGGTTADSGFDAGCKTNSDCTDGKVCAGGLCRPCAANSECSTGICLVGACHCTLDSQCPAPQKCIGNVCVNPGAGTDGGVPIVDSGADSGNCAGKPIYKTYVPNVASKWTYMAFAAGTVSGNEMCKAAAAGVDHVCDYEEVKAASARGELAAVPVNTTFWLHRLTNTPLAVPPGSNARCENWTYSTNHLSQGEYGTVTTAAGAVTFDFAPSATPGASAGTNRVCGGMTRAILCCAPTCI